MTEEQAKKKWCPEVRIPEPLAEGTYNRVKDNDPKYEAYSDTRCIASGCMMWVATDNEYVPQEPSDRRPSKPKPAGFCGLSRR